MALVSLCINYVTCFDSVLGESISHLTLTLSLRRDNQYLVKILIKIVPNRPLLWLGKMIQDVIALGSHHMGMKSIIVVFD